ncbi:hypothetical protein [Shewanella baltica]|uniref:hypothetical protein n=1 Tax=Shewanella baltica TaxID=62322 RepID=UPI0002D8688A|nr:hypothetical protein [Shewanella baltica]
MTKISLLKLGKVALIVLLTLIFTFIFQSVFHQNGSAVSVYSGGESTPTALTKLLRSNSNNKITQHWSVTDGNAVISGWLVDLAGQKQIYWSVGNFVLAGGLVDQNGVNLTEQWAKTLGVTEDDAGTGPVQQQAARVPTATQDYTEQDWQSLASATYIQVGVEQSNPDNAIYIFFEPYCGACSGLLERFKPIIDEKGLDVRLIPLAWISSNSVPVIQGMINGGRDAVWAHEAAKISKSPSVTAVPTPETKMAIIQNSELMGTLGVSGTPTVFYRENGVLIKAVNSQAALLKAVASKK